MCDTGFGVGQRTVRKVLLEAGKMVTYVLWWCNIWKTDICEPSEGPNEPVDLVKSVWNRMFCSVPRLLLSTSDNVLPDRKGLRKELKKDWKVKMNPEFEDLRGWKIKSENKAS